MTNPMAAVIRASTRPATGPYNILTFVSHERYESALCNTNHNFFAIDEKGYTKGFWNTNFASIPDNYTILNSVNSIPFDIDFDMVLCHNRFGQYDLALEIASRYVCPVIVVEHTSAPESGSKHKVTKSKLLEFYEKKGHINIFISEYSRDVWGWSKDQDDARVIQHGIDTSLFQNTTPTMDREGVALSVVNMWKQRDWCCGFDIWKECSGYPNNLHFPIKVVGDNEELSRPAKDVEELVAEYNAAKIFLNTSLVSPIPMTLLEAMSCGCAVVSTATCMIPEIIEHGKNGFMSDKPEKLREYVEMLRNDEDLCCSIGAAARQTIEEFFSLNKFVSEWNKIFNEAGLIGEKMA